MTLAVLTTFFGWMAVINIAFLTLSTLALLLMKKFALSVHGQLFGMKEEALNAAYFDYLARYKILTLAFSVAPYFALKLSM